MQPNAVSEEIPEFETRVIGITCLNGIPTGIVFFHEGKVLGAELAKEQMDTMPVMSGRNNNTVSTLNAPADMVAVVRGVRLTRDSVHDFRVIRRTVISYEVTKLRRD